MKNLCSIFACFFLSGLSWGQTVEDDFDTYKTGEYIGLESNGKWTTWYNNPGGSEDAVISNKKFHSAPNSIKIEASETDTIDVILPLGNHSSGIWNLSFWMHTKQGHGAYFNLLHAFEPNASNWAAQFWFSKIGHGHLTVGGGALNHNFIHPRASWFEVSISINIDADLALLAIDGEEITHWKWSEGSMNQTPTNHSGLAALSFVSAAKQGSTAMYYVDDVLLSSQEIGIKEFIPEVNAYPNPSSNYFRIENSKGLTIDVFDIHGRKLYSKLSDEQLYQIDCSSWKRGVYILQHRYKGNSIQTSKLLLK